MVKSRRAGSANDCPHTFCFNCEELGHKAESCPSLELCCICKHHSYWAKYCPYSWYHQPSPQIFALQPPKVRNSRSQCMTSQSKPTWIYRLTSSQLFLMSPHTRDPPTKDSSPAEDAPPYWTRWFWNSNLWGSAYPVRTFWWGWWPFGPGGKPGNLLNPANLVDDGSSSSSDDDDESHGHDDKYSQAVTTDDQGNPVTDDSPMEGEESQPLFSSHGS